LSSSACLAAQARWLRLTEEEEECPGQILPPARHDDIWAILRDLDFPGTVYGVDRDTPAAELMARQAEWYGHHRDDRAV
jgi:hypothetical protein